MAGRFAAFGVRLQNLELDSIYHQKYGAAVVRTCMSLNLRH